MLDFINCNIEQVSVHQVGNKTNEEDLFLSDKPLETPIDLALRELLFRYFLTPFDVEIFHSFTFANGDFHLNPLFQLVSDVFDKPRVFHKQSIDIAKYLYDVSIHPQIKSGDLFLAFFTDIRIDDELVDAVGIFKSEIQHPFLKIHRRNGRLIVNHDSGINIDNLDKGCLILNTAREDGFRICVVDKTNGSKEAQFWKDIFLNLKFCDDPFYKTSQVLKIAKEFVTGELSKSSDISKAGQIDLLNRSLGYFKENEWFDRRDFEETVFEDNTTIGSFRDFNKKINQINGFGFSESFEISRYAVNKQAKFFRSVLKLDKNFHVYIHGNGDMIEQGVDRDGRKYYKLYYDHEA